MLTFSFRPGLRREGLICYKILEIIKKTSLPLQSCSEDPHKYLRWKALKQKLRAKSC